MSIAAPDLRSLSIEQLLERLQAGMVGSPMHQQAMFMLQFRIAEKQAEAAIQQATAAQEMIPLTRALAGFTRAVARATWVLGGATAVLIIIQILTALRVIH
jgi:hypothetical protein